MSSHAELWSGHLEQLDRWCETPWDEPPAPPRGELPAELADRARELLARLDARQAALAEELRARRASAPPRRPLSVAGGATLRSTLELDA